MSPEKKIERLVKKNFQSLEIPWTLKKRNFHKTKQGDKWIYEVGEKNILIRYFVTVENNSIHLRRVITKFYEDRYSI